MMIRVFRHFIPLQILLLIAVHGVMLVAAMHAGVTLRFLVGDQESLAGTVVILKKAVVYSALMLGAMSLMGLYARDVLRSSWDYSVRLLSAFAAGAMIMTMVFYAVPWLFLGRGAFALTLMISLLGVIGVRSAFLKWTSQDSLKRRVLVLGAGTRAQKVGEVLAREDLAVKFHLVGYVPLGGAVGDAARSRLLDAKESLMTLAARHNVEEIIVGVRDRRGGVLPMDDLLECKLAGISVVELSTFFEREVGHIQVDSLNPSWLVYSDGFCQTSFRSSAKRIFDVLASVALMVPGLPLMALMTTLIWIESGAPVLYRQRRVGECGQVFELLKFRSMRAADPGADRTPQWARPGDERVTAVGRFMRRTRIDELPQIFNVLRGEMSFVGPRPERPYFVEELTRQVPHYAKRHSVKPGITGWAQVNYPYGASVEDARNKLQYDLYYAKNHSLFLDIVILFQTVQVVLFGKGAR